MLTVSKIAVLVSRRLHAFSAEVTVAQEFEQLALPASDVDDIFPSAGIPRTLWDGYGCPLRRAIAVFENKVVKLGLVLYTKWNLPSRFEH